MMRSALQLNLVQSMLYTTQLQAQAMGTIVCMRALALVPRNTRNETELGLPPSASSFLPDPDVAEAEAPAGNNRDSDYEWFVSRWVRPCSSRL